MTVPIAAIEKNCYPPAWMVGIG